MMLAILSQIDERENKVKYDGSAFQLTTQIDNQTFQTPKLI